MSVYIPCVDIGKSIHLIILIINSLLLIVSVDCGLVLNGLCSDLSWNRCVDWVIGSFSFIQQSSVPTLDIVANFSVPVGSINCVINLHKLLGGPNNWGCYMKVYMLDEIQGKSLTNNNSLVLLNIHSLNIWQHEANTISEVQDKLSCKWDRECG